MVVDVDRCPFVQRQSSWSETQQKTWSSLQFLAKVVDVPVVVTTGTWHCQSRLLWRVRRRTVDELMG